MIIVKKLAEMLFNGGIYKINEFVYKILKK